MSRARLYAAFALLAAVLMLPAIAAPPMHHDSFWIDRTWSEQFTMLLRRGTLYPRWLPLSFGGLGAPVFYFYAPLSFHLAGLFGLAGLATYPALLAAFAAAWFGSGVSMHLWLAGRVRAPALGALLYMVLPYHVIDFYARGALAEFCALALLPLVALGVVRTIERDRAWPLALAYTALIMTHLPTAVLASVLLIAPLALWTARGDRRRLLAAARGVAGGLAGAMVYLLPALTLQRFTSIGSLWAVTFLQPANWSLLHPHAWPSTSYVLLFAGLALTTAVAAMTLADRRRAFWPVWTVLVCAIVAGLVPGFWSLPVLKAVQFPWRALGLAEFGLVTVIADRRGSPVRATAMLLPLLAMAMLMLSPTNPLHGEEMKPLPIPGRQEVIEYLPPGAVADGRVPRVELLRDTVARARAHPGGSFPFPSLASACGGSPAADPAHPLLVHAPPGCAIVTGHLPAEQIGLGISLAAWIAFGMAGLRRARSRTATRAGMAAGVSAEPV